MGADFMYDLQVDVESTPNSRVLEVIEHKASPKYVHRPSLANHLRVLADRRIIARS